MAKTKTPYLAMRDGRPRWVPSPVLRARGFKGQDLKDEHGAWMTEGAAIDAANKLTAATRPQAAAPGAVLALLPAPALAAVALNVVGAHAVAAMVHAFLARPKISLDERIAGAAGKKPLARTTRLAYHNHGQLLIDWVGDMAAADITPAMLENFYADRVADRGVITANAIMRSFKSFFFYGEDKLRWKGLKNPCVGLEMDEAPGRLVLWSLAQIACYVAWADYLGWPSLGDAVIVALLTSQRRNDILPVLALPLDGDGIYRFKTSKTGRDAKVKAVPMLLDRVRALRARKLETWPERNAAQTFEIVCDKTGEPYAADGSYFGKRFRAVKLIAAGGNGSNSDMADALSLLGVSDQMVAACPIARMPTLANVWFRDLRDTAITWLAAAGCNKYEIAVVSSLSIQSVDAILDKHYLVRDDAFAISAGDKLAAYLSRSA